MKLLKSLLIGALALVCFIPTTSCDDDNIDCDKPMGYFQGPGIHVMDMWLDYNDSGSYDIQLKGKVGEKVIPIVWITDSDAKFNKATSNIYGGVEEGVLYPKDVFEADGYSAYPNSLEYMYEFEWIKVSTYKKLGSTKGILHLEYKANDTDQTRYVYIYLRNQDEGLLCIQQYPKREPAQ